MAIAIVSTWPPRRCGLASFAYGLRNGLTLAGEADLPVVAVSERPGEHPYGPEVAYELVQDAPATYAEAARVLDRMGVDAVLLQHEYGIFGGPDGRFVLELAGRLRAPLFVTAHTVRAEPSEGQAFVLARLAERSRRVVVMARRAADLLARVYGVPAEKVAVIPHGVPAPPSPDHVRSVRRELDPGGRILVMTLGLLGPGKGIEQALEAMDMARRHAPELLYVIVGATHPGEIARRGEAYRAALVREVERRGLEGHVRFVDRYLTEEEVLAYMGAADIYVTPYPGREQVSSGTLTFAVAMGLPVISTPYAYAEELLAGGAGWLVPFGDVPALARALEALAGDAGLRAALGGQARRVGSGFGWPRVARSYAALLRHGKSEGELLPAV